MELTRGYLKKHILYGPLLLVILALLLLRPGIVQALALQCGQWSIVNSPSPGKIRNVLNAVTSISARNAWAVGSIGNPHEFMAPLIEHWNGTKWKVAASPDLPRAYAALNAVSAISANDIWAVGEKEIGQGSGAITEHWDGSSWAIIPTPTPAGHILRGVAGSAANDVWSVGISTGTQVPPVIEHWNGNTWSIVKSPNPPSSSSTLNAISVISANDVWAVGSSLYPNGVQQTLTEHWNGTSWNIIASPNPSGLPISYLAGVSASSSNDVWSVGDALHSDGSNLQTLIEHWNGSSWSIVSSTPPVAAHYSLLSGVVAIAANDAWAVGTYDKSSGPFLTLTEHWDGSSWSVISSPTPPSIYDTFLNGVTATSASTVWTVGNYTTDSQLGQTLIEFYC